LSKSRFSWIKPIVFDKKEEKSSDDNSRNSIDKNILDIGLSDQINASKNNHTEI